MNELEEMLKAGWVVVRVGGVYCLQMQQGDTFHVRWHPALAAKIKEQSK